MHLKVKNFTGTTQTGYRITRETKGKYCTVNYYLVDPLDGEALIYVKCWAKFIPHGANRRSVMIKLLKEVQKELGIELLNHK